MTDKNERRIAIVDTVDGRKKCREKDRG